MRLLFCLQRKVSIYGLKIRDFRYDANVGAHVLGLKAYTPEEFNAVSREILTKNADLGVFVKIVSDDVQPVATAEVATAQVGEPSAEPIVAPVTLPASVVTHEDSEEAKQAIATLTKINDLLDTWPGASDEPLSVNVARLIAENAELSAKLSASPAVPVKPRGKPGRKPGFSPKAKAAQAEAVAVPATA